MQWLSDALTPLSYQHYMLVAPPPAEITGSAANTGAPRITALQIGALAARQARKGPQWPERPTQPATTMIRSWIVR